MTQQESVSAEMVVMGLVKDMTALRNQVSGLEDRIHRLGEQILANDEYVSARLSRLNSRLDKAEGIHGAR